VTQTLIKSWWLLALCGILYAIFAVIIFLMASPGGSLILHTFARSRTTIALLGMLALAAGACTIAASIWSSRRGSSWLLVLNGLACSSFGWAVSLGATRPITFPTIALLIVVMAASIGIYELATARALRWHLAEEWIFGAAGVVSIGFAVAFLAFVLRWIKLDPESPVQTFHWMGSYFGFSAVCMLALALRRNGPRLHIPHVSSRALPTG
jgi:uncharacterized membrane protein HdeD (DUF308 family)